MNILELYESHGLDFSDKLIQKINEADDEYAYQKLKLSKAEILTEVTNLLSAVRAAHNVYIANKSIANSDEPLFAKIDEAEIIKNLEQLQIELKNLDSFISPLCPEYDCVQLN